MDLLNNLRCGYCEQQATVRIFNPWDGQHVDTCQDHMADRLDAILAPPSVYNLSSTHTKVKITTRWYVG